MAVNPNGNSALGYRTRRNTIFLRPLSKFPHLLWSFPLFGRGAEFARQPVKQVRYARVDGQPKKERRGC